MINRYKSCLGEKVMRGLGNGLRLRLRPRLPSSSRPPLLPLCRFLLLFRRLWLFLLLFRRCHSCVIRKQKNQLSQLSTKGLWSGVLGSTSDLNLLSAFSLHACMHFSRSLTPMFSLHPRMQTLDIPTLSALLICCFVAIETVTQVTTLCSDLRKGDHHSACISVYIAKESIFPIEHKRLMQ